MFQVNLGRTPDMSSISNMPISQEAVPIGDTGYVWDVYEDSLRMSTYLLAFIVSDFSYRVSAKNRTPPDLPHLAKPKITDMSCGVSKKSQLST